jgi:hypothetical protein
VTDLSSIAATCPIDGHGWRVGARAGPSERCSLRDAVVGETAASSSTCLPKSPLKQMRCRTFGVVRNMLFSAIPMDAEALCDRSSTLVDAENWLALGAGAVLLLVGASRRSTAGACLAVSSAPLLYRGITGRWPAVVNGSAEPDSTRTALGGDRGVHVRESIRLELPSVTSTASGVASKICRNS